MKHCLLFSVLIGYYCLLFSQAPIPTPISVFEGKNYSSNFGYSLTGNGDLNGDGFLDLAVGAPIYNFGDPGSGAVFVYYGNALGIDTTADIAFFGDQYDCRLGQAVAINGDINNDGYDDLVYSASDYDIPLGYASGRVFIHYGSQSGVSALPSVMLDAYQVGSQFGYNLNYAGDVNGDGFTDLAIAASTYDNGNTDEGRVYVYHGSALGLNVIPIITYESNSTLGYMGIALASAGDVNGDGYDDLMMTASGVDAGEFNEGRVYIYHGSSVGLSATPAITFDGNVSYSAFGNSLAGAGDLNNDGFDDILISQNAYSGAFEYEGRVFIYYGSDAGITPIGGSVIYGNKNSAHCGTAISYVANYNNDEFDDVLISGDSYSNGEYHEGRSAVYLGSASGILSEPAVTFEINQIEAHLGRNSSRLGDINYDGFDDIAINASSYDNEFVNEGAVIIYYGSDCIATKYFADSDEDGFGSTLDYIVSCSPVPGFILDSLDCVDSIALINPTTVWYVDEDFDHYYSETGSPIAQCPSPGLNYNYDINGSGDCDDFNEVVFPGAIELLDDLDNDCDGIVDDGTIFTLTALLEGNQVSAGFATDVANAGDLNNDGYDDIIIGAPYYNNGIALEGAAMIYYGSAAGINTTPDVILDCNQANSLFGYAVCGAGDLNADGYDDIAVGAYAYDAPLANEGGIFVYLGSAVGVSNIPSVIIEGNVASYWLGSDLSSAGDVNGDGYDDLIAGAQSFSSGESNEGAIFIYHGKPSGINTTPATLIQANKLAAYFGNSVSGGGDVNGDGYDDVVVGAYNYAVGQSGEGHVFVYHGSATGLITTPARTYQNNQAGSNLGRSVAMVNNLNGDAYADIVVGADGHDVDVENIGGVFVYLGSASGLSFVANDQLKGYLSGANFGSKITAAGDVNLDGFEDILVGAYDDFIGEYFEGIAYLYAGNSGGMDHTPLVSFQSNQASAGGSKSLSGSGDFNDDGAIDIIFGAPYYDNTESLEGAAFIYFGCTDTYFLDADGDGFGGAISITTCIPSPEYVITNSDCNDDNETIYPFASELCNGLDDNCNVNIDEGLDPLITISAGGPTTFCQGSNVMLTATYTGYALQWEKNGALIPGATFPTYVASTKGNFSCVVDNACGSLESSPIFVNVLKNPSATISAGGPTTFCVGGSVVLNANSGAGLSYQWFKNAVEIPGATSITYTATTAGIYKCKVIKTATGCFKMSNGITVTVPCKEGEMLNGILTVYPNPATNAVNISYEGALYNTIDLQITNSIGQIVFNNNIHNYQMGDVINVDVSTFPAGIYHVRFIESGRVTEQQFVVQ